MEPSITDPTALTPAITADANGRVVAPFPAEDVPNLDHLITEDNTPVDSFFVEKQQRLLTEPLNSCWPGPGDSRPFIAASNVGVFFEAKNPALVPDMFLSLDVRLGEVLMLKPNRSYFCWLRGKVPDLMLEIVSDRTGGEEGFKMQAYCRMQIPFYVIFDPSEHLGHGVLRGFRLLDRSYQPMSVDHFPGLGLGLRLWRGVYEDYEETWLRWCDLTGAVIPTGKEKSSHEKALAEQERQRAEKLRDQLRALGIDPSA
jgi:Uma2 family endonuclease